MLWIYSRDFSSKGQSETIRGNILDRNGLPIATSLSTKSICCDPMRIDKKFYDIIQAKYNVDLKKHKDLKHQFLWLGRHVDDGQIGEMKHIPGVYIKNDSIRKYPFWDISSNLIGFCDQNSHGKHGVEYSMNSALAKGDVHLSMDIQMQELLHKVLRRAYFDFAADGSSGIIIDMRLGRIRAMVSVPTPISRMDFLDHNYRERNLDPVEVGSVMKLFNVALALESGEYEPDSIVDARGPMIIDKFEINDFMGVDREITLSESLWRSSNIANARVALSLGKKLQRKYLKQMGIFDRIEWMPGCYVNPLPPKKWGQTTTATLGYGYGLGMTTLHLAQVVFAATTGKTMSISILERPTAISSKPIFSDSTVKNMRKMMRQVITKSHRKTLLIRGCKAGAKTGTANLLFNGKYVEGRNFVTLVTVFPIDEPKLMVILQMNDPKKRYLKQGHYTTAGNVLAGYMREILHDLVERI